MITHSPGERIGVGQQSAGIGEKVAARVGQNNATGTPLKQQRSNLRLQPLDLLTQWWLGHVQSLGGATKVQLFGHHHEVPETFEVHAPIVSR